MDSETRQLLRILAKLNQAVPGVILRILDGSLSTDQETEFANLMIDVGETLRDHAQQEHTTIDSPTNQPPQH
jgi:hypothetical protein